VLWSLILSSFSLPVSEIYECRVEKNLCALLLNFIVKFVDLSRNVCVCVFLARFAHLFCCGFTVAQKILGIVCLTTCMRVCLCRNNEHNSAYNCTLMYINSEVTFLQEKNNTSLFFYITNE